MPYHVGDRVEVLGLQPGQVDIFVEANVMHVAQNHIIIQYQRFVDQHDEPLQAVVDAEVIRPYPPRIVATFNHGDDVNAWIVNGWVRGRYQMYEPDNPQGLVHCIQFPHMPEGQQICNFPRDHVRFHQHFQFADNNQNIANWRYRRVLMTGFQPGDRVEVLGFQQGMENSFCEATVVDVFADQVLVMYDTIHDNQNNPLVELVDMESVRPYPSRIVVDFFPEDDVDVFYNDCWWWGTYHQYQPNHPNRLVHRVRFGYMNRGQRLSNYRTAAIRMHQEFEFEDEMHIVSVWTYTTRV